MDRISDGRNSNLYETKNSKSKGALSSNPNLLSRMQSQEILSNRYDPLLDDTISGRVITTESFSYRFRYNSLIEDLQEPRRMSSISSVSDIEDLNDPDLLTGYLQVRFKRRIEVVELYTDTYPLLELRKAVMTIGCSISELCLRIIKLKFFESLVILVILLNTVVLSLEYSATDYSNTFSQIEDFFLYFYTTEFIMKVLANGLVLNQGSYLRDKWNLLDLSVVLSAWISVYGGSNVKINVLRILRILRPLRSISSVRGIRVLFLALFQSVKPLASALVILFFFILIFAIAGLQLWSGTLNQACISTATGIGLNTIPCGVENCPENYVCAESLDNPKYGTINFDNIMMSFVMVFQILSLEGWTTTMEYTQRAFSYLSILYYIPCVFIGAYLIINLTLAIITINFTRAMRATNPEIDDGGLLDFLDPTKEETLAKPKKKRPRINSEADLIIRNPTEGRSELLHSNSVKKLSRLRPIDIKSIATPKISFPMSLDLESDSSNNCDGSFVSNNPGGEVASPKFTTRLGENSNSRELKVKGSVTTCDEVGRFKSKDWNQTPDCSNVEHLRQKTVILQKIKQSLTIKRDLSAVLSNKVDDFFGMHVSETYNISSNSCGDVLPREIQYEENYYESFKYELIKYSRTNEKLPEKYIGYSLFNVKKILFLQRDKHKAFHSIHKNVAEIISIVGKEDCRNKAIIGEWSGADISINSEDYKFSGLNSMGYRVWSNKRYQIVDQIRFVIRQLMLNKYTINLVTLAIVTNTAILSVDHYGISASDAATLDAMNTVFTYFFLVELALRCIGIGYSDFLRDRMNYFDTIVVVLSVIELSIINGGGSALSAFRAVRIFRIFRVLRVVRLLRYLKSIASIIKAISKSMSNFVYLFMLIALLLIIFTLLGMTIYSGQFNFPEGLPRGNFDTFHWAFVTTFQVLTTENWNDILTSSLRSTAGPGSCLYLIVWVVLGNYIFLNLFLAILIESFSEEQVNDDLDPPEIKLMTAGNKKIVKKLKQIQEMKSESESEHDSDVFTDGPDPRSPNERVYQEFLFQDNFCEKSYFIFSKSNKIRILCFKTLSHPMFDNVTLAIIALNSIKLAWDTYLLSNPATDPLVIISNDIDYVFTSLFCLEFVLKTIGLGFCYEEGTYLKSYWNVLDFLIVGVSIVDASVSSINVPIIKVFRLLRALRPLKLIKHNISMKIVVIALIESIRAIMNIIVVILIIWLVFAILGVSLLAGKMYSCSNSNITTEVECLAMGNAWVLSNSNFNNVLEAMVTLFIVMSQESWPNRMLEGVDAVDIGIASKVNANPVMAYFYIVYFIIGNFFLLNLFTAVVFDNFTQAKKNESSIAVLILTREQMIWTELQQMILNSKQVVEASHAPTNSFRAFLFHLSKQKIFEVSMMIVTVINMITMAMPYQQASAGYLNFIENINIAFSLIFIFEACIKIIGHGPTLYIKNNWNKLDFFIAISSGADLILMMAAGSSIILLRSVPQLFRIIRVLRILRLLRLVKALSSLMDLIMIIAYVMPVVLNILSLLLLVFFIFAVLGSYLFQSVTNGQIIIGEYYNFRNFGNSMVILWRMSTGEDYPSIMYDVSNALGSKLYYLYFIVFITLIDFVILELFVSVIIQNYEEETKNTDSALQIFSKDIKIFRKTWNLFTEHTHGFRISKDELVDFIQEFGPIYELIPSYSSRMDVIKLIGSLNIKNIGGYFYFHDVLYSLMKRRYGKKIYLTRAKYSSKLMRMEEVKSIKRLDKVREKAVAAFNDMSMEDPQDNLFIKLMYMRNILTKWRAYTKNKKAKRSVISITPRFSDIEYPGENSMHSLSSIKN